MDFGTFVIIVAAFYAVLSIGFGGHWLIQEYIPNTIRNRRLKSIQKKYPNAYEYMRPDIYSNWKERCSAYTSHDWEDVEKNITFEKEQTKKIYQSFPDAFQDVCTRYECSMEDITERFGRFKHLVETSSDKRFYNCFKELSCHEGMRQLEHELTLLNFWKQMGQKQEEFTTICGKISSETLSQWSKRLYDLFIPFSKERNRKCVYNVYQIYRCAFCQDSDLDYSFCGFLKDNNQTRIQLLNKQVVFKTEIYDSILNFISSLKKSVEKLTVLYGDTYGFESPQLNNYHFQYLHERLINQGIFDINSRPSDYGVLSYTSHSDTVIIIDLITTNKQFSESCKHILDESLETLQIKRIVYLSLEKEFSTKEAKSIFEKEREKVIEKASDIFMDQNRKMFYREFATINGVDSKEEAEQIKYSLSHLDALDVYIENEKKELLRIASMGDMVAAYKLATWYKKGKGFERNIKAAINWFEQAAVSGHVEAQFELSLCYLNDDADTNSEKIFFWLSKAANSGHIEAINMLGVCYEKGIGTPKDYLKAFKQYEQAASLGLSISKYNLGCFYEVGTDSVNPDKKKAMSLYLESAKEGESIAQLRLAHCYSNGTLVNKNPQKYLYWLEMAANNHLAAAEYELGMCYWHGVKGIPKNLYLAQDYLFKAYFDGYNCRYEAKEAQAEMFGSFIKQ